MKTRSFLLFFVVWCSISFLQLTTPRDTISQENFSTTSDPLKTAPKSKAKPKDTCIQGYVWREARPSDHVCVRPEIRDQVAQQNRTRAKRWTSGAYGPQTCIQGYVWREAFDGDKVCVTPEIRENTKRDNQEARRRIAR